MYDGTTSEFGYYTNAVTLTGLYGDGQFVGAITAAVPEISTWAMLLAGLGCIGLFTRRWNAQADGMIEKAGWPTDTP